MSKNKKHTDKVEIISSGGKTTVKLNGITLQHIMQVSSGAFSYDTAIRNAIKSAAAQGVSVIYPSGWVDSLDVAIRRSVLTGVNQTAGQLQMMRADELDNDIMEITAHAGARLEHAWWQGKLVSLSGKKGYLTLRDIGYGDVRGFMGANCRHNWHIFFVGISTPAYTPAQLEEFKNETVPYNGKDIPLWKANDHQRGLERGIKAKKRQLVAIDEALKNTDDELLKSGLNADFESLAVKLKSQEAKLKDFCKQTGIPRQASREQAFSVKTEKTIKNWGKSVSQKAVQANKAALTRKAESDIINKKLNLMPNRITATTAQEKLQGYLLNSNHPKGKEKAKVINSVLGYHYQNWNILSDKIFNAIQTTEYTKKVETKHGTKYEIPVLINGEKGRSLILRTIWQTDVGSNVPRFITATFNKKNAR